MTEAEKAIIDAVRWAAGTPFHHRPWWKNVWSWVFVAACAMIFWREADNLRAIQEAPRAVPSPIRYVGPWQPKDASYRPGQTATFSFTHTGGSYPDGEPVAFLSIGSFRDLDSGISYPAQVVVGQSRDSDPDWTVRPLPSPMSASKRVVFRGLLFCFGRDRSLPEAFESTPFEVVPWGSEKEAAAARAAGNVAER